jgi:hypothetical protein
MELEDLNEYTEVIWNECLGDASFENKLINGLFYEYVYESSEGHHPAYTLDLDKAQGMYNKFRDWATSEISDFRQSVEVVYDEYYEEMEEEEGETVADEMAFEQAMEYALHHHWEGKDYSGESAKWALKQDNINLNKDIEELLEHIDEYKDWEAWDRDFEFYLDEVYGRLEDDKEKIFKEIFESEH